MGFSLGLMRAGYLRGLAAWAGFILPSVFALVLFAYGAGSPQRPNRRGPFARLEARCRRHCRAGGLGDGAHALPRPAGLRSRSLRRSSFCSAPPLPHRSGYRVRRYCGSVALPCFAINRWRACDRAGVPQHGSTSSHSTFLILSGLPISRDYGAPQGLSKSRHSAMWKQTFISFVPTAHRSSLARCPTSILPAA